MKNKIYYSALILLNIVIIFSVYIVIENNQNKKIENYTDSINTKINNAQNSINKAIHWFCVPLIMLSLIGLLWDFSLGPNINLGLLFIAFACLYYLRMSFTMFLGMAFIGILFIPIKIF